ncbi:hypothetical protein E1292_02895 [Nonomuraea deserti]|uniref:Uncharacterized protein n=1 Tax=Nonomuraea deserti TaxID=1848322 RepID=A0A4R4W7L6_9ACTN|nr:hypothetical protein [Nonomuraea deserti]TDD12083.1 hypothetical protein E1292_02895 [Nonomuraea deserti]
MVTPVAIGNAVVVMGVLLRAVVEALPDRPGGRSGRPGGVLAASYGAGMVVRLLWEPLPDSWPEAAPPRPAGQRGLIAQVRNQQRYTERISHLAIS